MSTFGALNTAYRGLTAAQQGLNVAGQNIANAATEGYTRQRVQQSSIAAPAPGLFGSGRPESGNGVSVDGIARLGSSFLDAGVRSAGAQAGFASVRSSVLQGIEGILQEPGDNGISASLQTFWSAWQGAANQPGETAPAGQLLQAGNELTAKISSGYQSLTAQWSSVRGQAQDNVDAVNAAAAQVAAYNATIRSTTAAGGSANELIDARAKLTETISRLTGGTVREQADGTVDIHVGGNALVMGTSVRALALSGTQSGDSLGSSVQLEWADRPGRLYRSPTAKSPARCPSWRRQTATAPAARSPRRRRRTTRLPEICGTPSTHFTTAPRLPPGPWPAISSAPPRACRRR